MHKAISCLKDARKYAIEFDRLFMQKPSKVAYDSPYLSLLEFDSEELLIYGRLEDNRRIDSFKSWLDGICFDTLRNNKEFTMLYDKQR